jgi:hypothetical protein
LTPEQSPSWDAPLPLLLEPEMLMWWGPPIMQRSTKMHWRREYVNCIFSLLMSKLYVSYALLVGG